jgi:hypothetical protein
LVTLTRHGHDTGTALDFWLSGSDRKLMSFGPRVATEAPTTA